MNPLENFDMFICLLPNMTPQDIGRLLQVNKTLNMWITNNVKSILGSQRVQTNKNIGIHDIKMWHYNICLILRMHHDYNKDPSRLTYDLVFKHFKINNDFEEVMLKLNPCNFCVKDLYLIESHADVSPSLAYLSLYKYENDIINAILDSMNESYSSYLNKIYRKMFPNALMFKNT